MKFTRLLWMLPAIIFLQGCSRSTSNVATAHHFDEPSGKWIIELPKRATQQEILSNYFTVFLLRDGKPIPIDQTAFKGTESKTSPGATNLARKIGRYSIVQAARAWCGGPDDFIDYYKLDTDQGQMLVSVELASNHSNDPKTTGWKCGFEDSSAYGFLFSTNRAEP